MRLAQYPLDLANLEIEIAELGQKVRERIYERDREDARIDLEAASLDKGDYPNAESRKAWAASERRGEKYMELQRKIDKLNDEKGRLEIEHRRTRREWKVAQMIEQKRIRAMDFWKDDTSPETPGYMDTQEPEDTPEETPGAYSEQENAVLEPDDDLPF